MAFQFKWMETHFGLKTSGMSVCKKTFFEVPSEISELSEGFKHFSGGTGGGSHLVCCVSF